MSVSIVDSVLYITLPDGISGILTVDYTIKETGKYFMIIRIMLTAVITYGIKYVPGHILISEIHGDTLNFYTYIIEFL